MIPIDALLFDLDGTLIDSKHDLARSVQWLQRRLGFPASTEDEIATFIGDGVTRLLQRALPALKGAAFQEALSLFIRYYRVHCVDTTRAYPGIRDVLWHFRAKKLAVVTNKPIRVTVRILSSLGLMPLFGCVVGGDSLRFKKPHPFPVAHALRLLDIHPLRSVLVGDGVNDVLAGRSAGTYTCGILSNIASPERLIAAGPDFVLLNSLDLMRIFH